MRYTKTLTGTKKANKPLDALNIDRHHKQKKLPATTQKWTHSSWNCCSFFRLFGTCAGLVHLVVLFFSFSWCLCRFGDSDFKKHWQAPIKKQTPRCTKHRQAPKKQKNSFQQLLRSAPIVPGCFLFFLCLCRFGDSDFTKHWQAAQTNKKHS